MTSLAAVKGRLFIILSTSMKNVDKASSVNILSLTIDLWQSVAARTVAQWCDS